MKDAILITGGTGFLGSNVLKRFLNDGHPIVLLKRSFSQIQRIKTEIKSLSVYNVDETPLSKPFEENQIKAIVHCATNYGRRDVSPTEIIEANLTLPLHLLQLAEKYGVQAFINTDTILDKGINHYSLSKSHFLDWLTTFSKNLKCVSVALEHFYGPYDDPSKFVTRMIQLLLSQTDEIDLTEGRQKRDFIFIDDVVSAFSMILKQIDHFETGALRSFELGSGKSVSIREFVELIKQLTENTSTQLRFGRIPLRKNEVMESKVNLAPLTELGWKPQVSLVDGLKETIRLERKGGGNL